MLPKPTEFRDNHYPINIQLSDLCNTRVFCFTLIAAASIIILIDHNSALALTRGTSYDDLLLSNMTIRNDMTDQMAITETTGVNGSYRDTGEFSYGDYGNDEIHGSYRSDHLSGGPGSDVIYGNDGGDYIEGGPGIDSLYGGAGNDVLSGGEGADYFDCGPGRDSIDDFDTSEGDYALNNCEVIENEERSAR
jgi:Ca2+-binding RTX toxin-like protein